MEGEMARALRGRAGLAIAAIAVTASGCVPGWTVGFAGTGVVGFGGDGGPANAALLDTPADVVVDPGGGYVFVDGHNCVVRRADRQGVITTIAGRGGECGDAGDGGLATAALLNPILIAGPRELTQGLLARDGAGNLYLDDRANGRIRRIEVDGTIDTAVDYGSALVWLATDPSGHVLFNALSVSGSGSGSYDGIYRFEDNGSITPLLHDIDRFGLAVGPDGSLFTTRITASPSGDFTSLYRRPPSGPEVFLVTVSGVTFEDLDVDAAGTVYATRGNTIVTIGPTGTVTTIAGNGSPDPATGRQQGVATDLALSPRGLAVTPGGGLMLSSGHVVYRLWLPDPLGPR
jgi:hypothetical protein